MGHTGTPTYLTTCLPTAPAADSTGTHSLYTTYQDYEIMFHVSTMLPYTPNNRQQVTTPFPNWFLPHRCRFGALHPQIVHRHGGLGTVCPSGAQPSFVLLF